MNISKTSVYNVLSVCRCGLNVSIPVQMHDNNYVELLEKENARLKRRIGSANQLASLLEQVLDAFEMSDNFKNDINNELKEFYSTF
jgi:hypothetical protein